MIKSYIKKPVEIQAVQFQYNSTCIEFLKSWLGKEYKSHGKNRHPTAIGWMEIGTLEDGDNQVKHIASEGDYIIKGIKGEFYPCKPDIFLQTYDIIID